MLVTIAVGNGFIVTAMLWGAFLAELIDRRLKRSALYLAVLAVLSFFGIIHSASPDGLMYFPWTLNGLARQIPIQFTLAYLVLGGLFLVLSFSREHRDPALPAQ
jgi:AGZA family xanthine/uracil permease-like MFS transporter